MNNDLDDFINTLNDLYYNNTNDDLDDYFDIFFDLCVLENYI